MKRIEVRIYSENEELPHLLEGNFFHSLELFQISEKVPSDTPIMAVATQEGRVVGQMLAVIHRRHILIPPFIYTHAHVPEKKRLFARYDMEKETIIQLLSNGVGMRDIIGIYNDSMPQKAAV